MINYLEFSFSHLNGFEPKEEFDNLEGTMMDNIKDPNRTIYSIVVDGKVVCIAGSNSYRAGTAEVWIIPSVLVDVYPLQFFKAIKSIVDVYISKGPLHRLEMAVKKDWDKGYKWAEKLGFSFEGIMKEYVKGNDHALFARVL